MRRGEGLILKMSRGEGLILKISEVEGLMSKRRRWICNLHSIFHVSLVRIIDVRIWNY